MPLQRAGRDLIAKLLVSTGVNTEAYGASAAYMVVGNNTGAESPATTWMLGTAALKAMDATFPTRSTNALTFQSTFSTAEANFAWQEWGVWNATASGSAAGSLLNRKLENPSLGTKTSAQSWQINATLTVTT